MSSHPEIASLTEETREAFNRIGVSLPFSEIDEEETT